ncbi:MAG TPA: hypothetical protein VGH96_01770 [Streptosporangiaceae bacterium]|jgi:hypothetical protein
MISFIPPRLRVPLVNGIAALLFAAAWLIHGGRLWWVSILVIVTWGVRVVVLYVRGGRDDDEGALTGGRADERLKDISVRSWALVGRTAVIAAFLGLTVGIAIRAPWWWQSVIMLGLCGLAYLFGLSNNGFAEEDPADPEPAGRERQSPVNS